MTAKRRMTFQQILQDLLAEDHPLSYSQLQGLSNLSPEELLAFRASWPGTVLERRQQVVHALVHLSEDSPDTNFRDVFVLCLDDPDEDVRIAAIEGLCDDESLKLLEHLLGLAAGDPSPEVRSHALLALGRFVYLVETTDLLNTYRQRLLRLLLQVFHDESAPLEIRRRALETVSYLSGVPEVEEAIRKAYDDTEREMRASAVHAMGHHMSDQWCTFIERELTSADPQMRYEAAYACGEMENPEMIPLLQPLLEDADHEVARAAIWALGEIGGERARRLLERCVRQASDDLREAAVEALHTLLFFEDPMQVL